MSKEYYEITFATLEKSFTSKWCAERYVFSVNNREEAMESLKKHTEWIFAQACQRQKKVIWCSLFQRHGGGDWKSHICYHKDVFQAWNQEILRKLGMLV